MKSSHAPRPQQVEFVLAGKSVNGHPFGNPIAFPKNDGCRRTLLRLTQDFSYEAGPRLTTQQRTWFIRKQIATPPPKRSPRRNH